MRSSCSTLVGVMSLAISALMAAPSSSVAQQVQSDPRVDCLFSRWDSSNTSGCALGVLRNGHLVYRHNYGMANIFTRTPISAGTAFYIGSMSKQFTGMCGNSGAN